MSITLEVSSLSKNAYLSIYISHNFLCASLAYTDQDDEKSYILSDKTFLPLNIANLKSSDFFEYWSSYFKTLEKKWNWNFLEKPKTNQGSFKAEFVNFKSEGVGISGCKVSISKNNANYQEIFQSLREFSLSVRIIGIDSESDKELLEKFANSLGYDDVLLLDLHSRFFKIARVEKREQKGKKDLSKIHLLDYAYEDIRINWGNVQDLLNLLNANKYKTFLSKFTPSNMMSNVWANFLQNPIFKTDSEILKDFIRAYITIQLLSLCSENPRVMKDFGVKPCKSLLWITGDLIEIPTFRELLISVIDGLQIRGTFDFVVDGNSLIYTYGKTFSYAQKSDEIFLTKETFLPKFTMVLAPDIDLKADSRKSVFHGALFGRKDESIDIFAMSSEITQVDIKDPETMYLEGKFIKNAYIEKYRKGMEFYCLQDGIAYEKIILDCRIKPAVYGPNIRANSIKFDIWLSGEHYS